MSEKLFGEISDDINARLTWETRQALWYQMRTNGLARKHKPWPNAADMHFPLIDTTINKLKPGFFQQAMGLDVLATFVPMRQQMAGFTTAAEQWFSYKLHEQSNYAPEVMSWIDHVLMSGHAEIKVFWDPKKKRVEFQAVDPMYVIVPPWSKGVDDADRLCHVMPMSVEAYKRAGIYDDSKATINRIRGGTVEDSGISSDLRNKREIREGLTYTQDRDQVIVWEVYTRDDEGKWRMKCFSPAAPDIPLRKEMEVPYDHGQPPFVSAMYEITDGGWYSPRGVCEMLAPFEASLCKTWNDKMDAATLYNRPLFRAERDLPNSVNLRMNPGQILPFGIAPVPMPAPPLDFDKEMQRSLIIAEQRVTVPDYGLNMAAQNRDRRTATEIESINAQSSQNMDLRLRLFRQGLGGLFRQAWGLLIQFDSRSLQYRFLEDQLMVDPVALHEEYQIEPRGGMDMVSRQMLLNRAVQRKMLFQNSPWINQPELDKSILELEDPSLVPRLLQDPNARLQDEIEDEQRVIPALLVGQMIPVKPGQNYQQRVGVIMDFLEQQRQAGAQFNPTAQRTILARLGALLNAMEKVDTNNARKMRKEVQKYLETIGFISTEQEAQTPVPPGAGPTPPVPPAQPPLPPEQPPPAEEVEVQETEEMVEVT